MDQIARWPATDRADLFLAAASQRGITPAIMEKDFWVCWTLRRIFSLPDPPASLILKGGTSLSKVYGAIDRFSEDVDLALDRADLGFGGDDDPASAPSRKKAQQAVKALGQKCKEVVQGQLLTQLTQHFADALASRASQWSLTTDDDDPLTLNFAYPRKDTGESAVSYIRPMVRLEFGARSDHWPAEEAVITPFVADEFGDRVSDPECRVKVLSGARTFWEKATILHSWHYAPEDKPFPDRQSRHYYDVARLAKHDIGTEALANPDLLVAVAEHKRVFFESAWAKYELARPGTLKLVPNPARLPALEADYAKMGEMIFGEQIPLWSILNTLKALEHRINSTVNAAPDS